ncbi:DUF2938 domain-containing protein [Myroides sp. WP-1]|uniref:DUF2938 domain-containing protein n=1 Tax=Myroides sp. WP-1 TaxID=2759944 RepID=UPI0015FDD51E|nr:DUF2938 domain-containing protein [Myroides sp. WP-1]MBB1138991.1 DUF2938 domain-containing protein [Myroides sp. WP-1]
MNTILQLLGYSIFIGVSATIFMDVYALVLRKIFQIPSLNYAFLGRWMGHFKQGVFRHPNIVQATPVEREKAIGWCAHYLIGIAFAFVLLLICGIQWIENPTLLPALLVGILTTIAPFFIMQPAFGFGIAASKTPNPKTARIRSLLTHTIYGIGLFLGGVLLHAILIQ